MKTIRKLKVLALLALVCGSVWGQKWNNTNIVLTNPEPYPFGISINSTYPKRWAREFSLSQNSTGKLFAFGVVSNGANLEYGYIGGNTSSSICYNNTWMVFKPNGNVGIGTTSPGAKLEVLGNVLLNSNSANSTLTKVNSPSLMFISSGYNGRTRYQRWHVLSQSNGTWGSGDLVFISNTDGMGNNERIRFCNNGNVGIGTTNPGSYKLAVEGIIGAHEIKVTTDGWADFVFDENYALPQLQEVEAYIQEHKHLPNIPSEQEVLKEGIALGEMDAKLLQKIEELTLYTISQEKKLDQKDKEVQELKEARRQMEERLQKLEALLLKDK